MKLTTLTQHFRKTKKDENGKQVEEKRPSVDYQIELLAGADDLATMVAEYPAAVVTVLNDAITGYAKRLFGQNSDNWDYVPAVEAVTVQALADELNAPRQNARILTNANLEVFGNWYRDIAAPAIGKTESAARNGGLLIQAKFGPALNKPAAIESFIAAFSQISTDCPDLLDALDDTQVAVFDSLLDLLMKAQEAKTINLEDI